MARRASSTDAVDRYTRTFAKGTVLFQEGDRGDCMYVLHKGRVEVAKRIGETRVTLAHLGPGDCLGEMAMIDGQPRSADAVVVEDSVLVVIPLGKFEKLVRESGEVAVRLLRKLSQRLREANRAIESFLAENGAFRAVEVLREFAGPPGRGGFRPLPAGAGPQLVAARAGLSLHEAEHVWERLRAAGLVDAADQEALLAPDAVLDDYLAYLTLKQKYDPLTASALAEMTGLPEDEVHRVIRRVLASKLASGSDGGLSDSYQEYLALKKRFEYLDRV